jgi:hypothetical protein
MGSLLDRAKARKSKSSSSKTPRKKSLTAEQQAVVDSAKRRTDQLLSDARGFTEAQEYIEEMKRDSPVKYDAAMAAAEKDRQKGVSQAVADASQLYEAGAIRDMKTEAASKAAGAAAEGVAARAGLPMAMQRTAGQSAKGAARALADKRPQQDSILSADNIRKGLNLAVTAPLLGLPALITESYAKNNPNFKALVNRPFMSQGAIDKAEKQASEGMSAQDQRYKLMLDAVKKAQEK